MKRLARATRNWRISVGLASEAATTSAELVRSRSRRALPGGRVGALEADVGNVIAAWNRHLPQVLAEIGDAKRAGAEARAARTEIARLESSIAELSVRVSALAEQVANLSVDPEPPEDNASGAKNRRKLRSAE